MKKIKIQLAILIMTIICFLFMNTVSYASSSAQSLIINSISIDNVLTKALKTDTDGNALIVDDKDYQIVYMPSYDHEFLIDIKSLPFTPIRKRAEQKLLDLLEVESKDACWLNIVVTSSAREENNSFRGMNLRPNFCETLDVPLSTPTPQIVVPTINPSCGNSSDINKDGVVNGIDYARGISKYGVRHPDYTEDVPGYIVFSNAAREDINCSGIVDATDLSILLKDLGTYVRYGQ